MAFPPKLYQFLIACFASLGSALFGYDLGVIAGAIGSASFKGLFNPTANETGAVVSVFTGGAFFGAAFAGPAGDYLGRKKTILLGSVIFLLGGALQTAAQSLAYLYAGRCIGGLGIGMLVMIIPLYQAELCHPDIRGRVTALQQFMLGLGALIASWTAFGAWSYPDNNSRQWRLPLGRLASIASLELMMLTITLAIQLIPAGILALLILLFPESPRWLMDQDRHDEALATLGRLHANGDQNDPWVKAEFERIMEAIEYEHEHEAKSYTELFTNRSSFRRLFLACAIQASIQMTGVSAIQYYSVTIFEQIGISGNDTLKYQGIASVIALLGEICCMAFIDYTGRRWALIGANIVNSIVFIIATILSALFPPGSSSNVAASWGFIVMTWIYQFSFSFGCGPLSWIIPAEIFDTRTRSKGVSIATMTSFAFNTMIGQVTSIAMQQVGYRFYITFIVCNATNALFFWAFLPETKRRPLEEMNMLFTKAPLFVPTMKKEDYMRMDLEEKIMEIETKEEATRHIEIEK